MAQYILRKIDSNEIVSTFEWDGIGDLTPLVGYEFELLVDSESQFTSYTASLLDSSSVDVDNSIFIGSHFGTFSGDLLGVTIGGNPIEYSINATPYGKLHRIDNNFNLYEIANAASWFQIKDDSTIVISSNNGIGTYKNILEKIVENNEKNFVITFKSEVFSGQRVEFLVKDVLPISYDNNLFYELKVENINYVPYLDILRVNTNPNEITYWNIDFTFNTSDNILSEYTGSFTGSFEGYAELTGSFFGAYKGLLDGTASNSIYALTASFAQNASSIEIIEKSKNWIKPSWAKTIRVTCVGGGGGGGAAPASETIGPVTGGGGGGGGTITVGEFDADTLPDVITITVGAGGIGGTHDGTNVINASNGGDTYFGNYLIARGGNYGWTGMSERNSVYGGSTIANINYLSTGAGGGGAGTIDGIMQLSLGIISDASKAPQLPLPTSPYVSKGEPGSSYYTVFPTPVPAVIAPTGGGGGLGYDGSNGGRQDGITDGGKISPYQLISSNNVYQSLSPYPYSSGSIDYYFGGTFIDTGHYPAFNTTVGLGGRGGNPFLIDLDLSSAVPTEGTIYGGGGGGAYGGGIVGRYAVSGDVNGTPYNFGANGARGVVVIISEA